MCNCSPTEFYLFLPTCLDNTIATITALIESNEKYTAQMMVDLIEENIQQGYSSVGFLPCGWIACLNPDCGGKSLSNSNNYSNSTLSNSDSNSTLSNSDSNSTPLIIGIIFGLLFVTVITLIVIIVVIWKMHRRYSNVVYKCLYTVLTRINTLIGPMDFKLSLYTE